jgi:hypothetical protein
VIELNTTAGRVYPGLSLESVALLDMDAVETVPDCHRLLSDLFVASSSGDDRNTSEEH